MTSKQWTALGTIGTFIGILVAIVIYRFASQQPIQATNSNVAVGNSAPVTQNLTVSSLPSPKGQFLITQESKKQSDGLYHTKISIGIGVVVGSKDPEFTGLRTPLGITCGPYVASNSGALTAFGPLTGRIQYDWDTNCVSKNPISEQDLDHFLIQYLL